MGSCCICGMRVHVMKDYLRMRVHESSGDQ